MHDELTCDKKLYSRIGKLLLVGGERLGHSAVQCEGGEEGEDAMARRPLGLV